MQISLKQSEINIALKQYITAQGIDLAGKSVAISFTAGRKEAGISADINIDDQDLPDFGGDTTNLITLSLVTAMKDATPVVDATSVINKAKAVEPEQKAAPDTKAEEPVVDKEAVPGKAGSLFS